MLEVEVDSSFPRDYYTVTWRYHHPHPDHKNYESNRIAIYIGNKHVQENFAIYCMVTSTEEWHRQGVYDDIVGLIYKVLPPMEK